MVTIRTTLLATMMTFLLGCLVTMKVTAQCLVPMPPTPAQRNGITLYEPITQDTANKVIAAIQAANQDFRVAPDPIYLYINSPGGSVLAGDQIVTAIEASRRPVYTVDVGIAASMGADIFSYGKKRYAFPRSILMYHNMSLGIADDLSHMTQLVGLLNKIDDSYNQHLANLTNLTVDQVVAKSNSQWWMLPDEMGAHGLIDEVMLTTDYPLPDPKAYSSESDRNRHHARDDGDYEDIDPVAYRLWLAGRR